MTGLGQAGGMTPEPTTYPGYRFPAEIIGHALWLYCENMRVAWRA